MSSQISHRHHYVPEFLMKPWMVENNLKGYWWDTRKGQLECNRKVPRFFCHQHDLLAFKEQDGRQDALEKDFFGEIDDRGAAARDGLILDGAQSLSDRQKQDFVKLLLSLEARRPPTVQKLRDGRSFLAEAIDDDPEISHEMEAGGLSGSTSERMSGLEDLTLSFIQGLVNDPNVSSRVVSLSWRVVRLGMWDGTFVLSDRPLFRLFGTYHPKASWFLPLNPKTAFYAANCSWDFERLTTRKFAKSLNVDSVRQAEKYVFCVDDSHNRLLEKHLPPTDST